MKDKINLLGYSYDEIHSMISDEFGRGKFHSKLLYENIYKENRLSSGKLDEPLNESYKLKLPTLANDVKEGKTIKFVLNLEDGAQSESIILPMGQYNTLCISSQIGCRWACSFCETGKLGLIRNLTTGEIISQLMVALHVYKIKIRNIVFMGMGEAFDNFDNVLKAIDIFSHPWAMNLNKKSICLSTVGHVEGINRLTSLGKNNDYHKLHLAVSLNGVDDQSRNKLMPVNKRWPLNELKEALKGSRQFGKKELLYFEYILIKGITDGVENGKKLISLAREYPHITLNLIPYNPGNKSLYEKSDSAEINRFHKQIVASGLRCFTRFSQGDQIMAACGQLGKNNTL